MLLAWVEGDEEGSENKDDSIVFEAGLTILGGSAEGRGVLSQVETQVGCE